MYVDTVIEKLNGLTQDEQIKLLDSEFHGVTGDGRLVEGPIVSINSRLRLDQEFTLPGRTRQETISIIESVYGTQSARGREYGYAAAKSRDKKLIIGLLSVLFVVSVVVTKWPFYLMEEFLSAF